MLGSSLTLASLPVLLVFRSHSLLVAVQQAFSDARTNTQIS
jgi:hypothetical protein